MQRKGQQQLLPSQERPPDLSLMQKYMKVKRELHPPDMSLYKGNMVYPNVPLAMLLHSRLIDFEQRHTFYYHFPKPAQQLAETLRLSAPANTRLNHLPSSHLWLQFSEPVQIGVYAEEVYALNFVNLVPPYQAKVVHELCSVHNPELEPGTQALYAKNKGIWVLDMITLTPAGEPVNIADATLEYDSQRGCWQYQESHECPNCFLDQHSLDGNFLWIECSDCRADREVRSLWFATALALVQGQYRERIEIHERNLSIHNSRQSTRQNQSMRSPQMISIDVLEQEVFRLSASLAPPRTARGSWLEEAKKQGVVDYDEREMPRKTRTLHLYDVHGNRTRWKPGPDGKARTVWVKPHRKQVPMRADRLRQLKDPPQNTPHETESEWDDQ